MFYLGQRRHLVVAVLDRRTEPPHEYFEVRVQDGRRFLLCHDAATGAWELAPALPKLDRARLPARLQLIAVLRAMLQRARSHRLR